MATLKTLRTKFGLVLSILICLVLVSFILGDQLSMKNRGAQMPEDTTVMTVNGDEVMLKLTHGTGDDNVHHQNTLLLVDELHKAQKKFDFMIYPDGMHGYYDYQGAHVLLANRDFWLQYLF